jgi:hypothetical protein
VDGEDKCEALGLYAEKKLNMRQVRSFRAHRIGLCQSQAIDLPTWYLSWRSPNTPYNLQIRLFSSKQLSLSINAVRAELQHKNIHASLLHFSEEDGRPHVLKYTTFLSLKPSKPDFAFVKIQKQHCRAKKYRTEASSYS